MDPLKSFEKKLLSGSLIDTTKLKRNHPPWLDPSRIPRIYRDLEVLVSVPIGADVKPAQRSLDTAKVYQVLLASGLPQQSLASIWDQCSKSVPGSLVPHEFYQALALVALSQAGNQPNLQLLTTLQDAPIPHLAIAGYPLPLLAAVQPQSCHGVDNQPADLASRPNPHPKTCSAQQGLSEPEAPASNTVPITGEALFKQNSAPNSPAEDEDDFADFQSAPSEAHRSAVNAPINNRISVPELSPMKPVAGGSLISHTQHPTVANGQGNTFHPVSTSHIIQSSTSQKSPKSTIVASSPKQPKLLPSVSLFDSITVPVTENVQPPSENNPWLGFSLERPGEKPTKKVARKASKDVLSSCAPFSEAGKNTTPPIENNGGGAVTKITDDEFDDFDDFQSAPVDNLEQDSESITGAERVRGPVPPPDQDKYSVFRLLDSHNEAVGGTPDADESLAQALSPFHESDQELLFQNQSSAPIIPPNKMPGEGSKDILSLIKLQNIPPLVNTFDDDLSQFDSLSLGSKNKVGDGISTSALLELQDLDVGFTVIDGPVASHPSSAEVSPAKSAASGHSVGESRGREHRLSIFTNKGNYAECASLSSFEMGPSTESNYSSPTKGSVVSLELNSRSPPDDEIVDEDDTLEWTIESGDAPQVPDEPSKKQRRSSDEFCWAQPPMFPPPDPTDSEKTSVLLNTGLYLQNFPETQKKKATRQQVADGWYRILSKAAAILESASVILGDDPVVLGEILSTPRGQSYIGSLLEVYNVTQQLKKSVDLYGVEGLGAQLQQVDDTWRGKLDDLATRLRLSVVCTDHLSSPIRTGEDTCAICLLPLNFRLPRILFGDNGYHSSCANFWANVLAEGLPCLKFSP